MSDRLLRLPEVEHRVGLKKACIYMRIKGGQFPRQVKLGSASRWRESEINAYVANPADWGSHQPSLPTPAS